jgi:hypothetical protein
MEVKPDGEGTRFLNGNSIEGKYVNGSFIFDQKTIYLDQSYHSMASEAPPLAMESEASEAPPLAMGSFATPFIMESEQSEEPITVAPGIIESEPVVDQNVVPRQTGLGAQTPVAGKYEGAINLRSDKAEPGTTGKTDGRLEWDGGDTAWEGEVKYSVNDKGQITAEPDGEGSKLENNEWKKGIFENGKFIAEVNRDF